MNKMISTKSQFEQRIFRISLALAWFIASVTGANPFSGSTVWAHDEYKEPMEQRYKLRSISCKACHTDNKDKSVMNAFGKLLHHELKPLEVTRKLEAAKAEGDEAEKAYQQQMVQEFLVALETVEKKRLTFAALLEAGLLYGVRLDPNQVDTDGMTVQLIDDKPVTEMSPDETSTADASNESSVPDSESQDPASSESENGDTTPPQVSDSDSEPEAAPPEAAPIIEGEVKQMPTEPITNDSTKPVPNTEPVAEPTSPSERGPGIDAPTNS